MSEVQLVQKVTKDDYVTSYSLKGINRSTNIVISHSYDNRVFLYTIFEILQCKVCARVHNINPHWHAD